MMIKSFLLSASLFATVQAFVPVSLQQQQRLSVVSVSAKTKRNHDDEDPEAIRRRLEREWGHQFNQDKRNNNNNNGGGPQYGNIDGKISIDGYIEPTNRGRSAPSRFGGPGEDPYRHQQQQSLGPGSSRLSRSSAHRGGGGHDPNCPMCHGSGKAYLGGTKPIECPQCGAETKHTTRLPPHQGWAKGAVEVPVLDDPNSNADYWIQDRQFQEEQQFQAEHGHQHHAAPQAFLDDEEDEYTQSYGHVQHSPYAPSIEFGPPQPQQDEGWIARGFEENMPPNFNEGFYDDDEIFGDDGPHHPGNGGGGGGYFGPRI